MEYTSNYDLKKPAYDDTADLATVNENFDAIDGVLAGKVESESYPIAIPSSAWSSGVATITHEAIPYDPMDASAPEGAARGDVLVWVASDATAEEAAAVRDAALEYVQGSQTTGSIALKIGTGGTTPTTTLKLRIAIVKSKEVSS
jgi:hypothetical protein